ncbi:MAG: redoxin domain-containing protein [Hydrogenophaga sp.]|nr:redoxin domain-containing protein [Hydrogenophaga sp.]NIN27771.1 redoxin domain-containing protein [Hydrogenophaga sp.]NIN32590.1 redoxin domain-containing protein [Hydrogenophaga sp.]NIN57044.1 redoxin domain-containing protein [Hydrogenophaga sp.]NIO53455.1 redoxin domain-containing protein [Hydrogenophaga sp.]
MSPVPRRALLIAGSSALAAGALAFWLPQPSREFKSVDITGADYARDFSLPDHTGRLRKLQEFRGRVVAVFFGFTQCPDVCPTTLTEMTRVKQLLGDDGKKLQVVFITVDPQRDIPAVLQAYMRNFDPQYLALVPTEQQLPEVAKEFKIYYKRIEGKTPSAYVMEHSAVTFIFDTKGRVRLYSRYGLEPEALASDVRKLLKEA